MTRMEWVLRKAGIDTLLACGIVTNGGVASTLRDAHVRDFALHLLTDACAAFTPAAHENAIRDLSTIARLTTCADAAAEITAAV